MIYEYLYVVPIVTERLVIFKLKASKFTFELLILKISFLQKLHAYEMKKENYDNKSDTSDSINTTSYIYTLN